METATQVPTAGKPLLRAFSSERFVLPLPDGHRFPMRKYSRLRELLRERRVLPDSQVFEAPPASDDELLTVHTRGYLLRVKSGRLDRDEQRLIGFPWSRQLVERSRRSVGATLAAARYVLDRGAPAFGVNLAGGTHHAFADHGEGFCVFNDAAVTARCLLSEGLLDQVLIVDCDVHQGNGTARIFQDDPEVFTLSLHGERNYPLRKQRSSLDVALPDDTGDDAYLDALDRALDQSLAAVAQNGGPDLAIYLAGADPHRDDRLGRLALSTEGLRRRDALVFERLTARRVPTVVTMAGGYSRDSEGIERIATVHCNTVEEARLAVASPSLHDQPTGGRHSSSTSAALSNQQRTSASRSTRTEARGKS